MFVSGFSQPTVRPATALKSPQRTTPLFGTQSSAPAKETPKPEAAPITLESLFQQFLNVLETLFNEIKGLLYHLKDTLTDALKNADQPASPPRQSKQNNVTAHKELKSTLVTPNADTPQESPIPSNLETSTHLEKMLTDDTQDVSGSTAPPAAMAKPLAFKSQARTPKTVPDDLAKDEPEPLVEKDDAASSSNEENETEKTSSEPATQQHMTATNDIHSDKAVKTTDETALDDETARNEISKQVAPEIVESPLTSAAQSKTAAVKPAANFEALSHKLLEADKNLREKLAAFEKRQAFLPKKGFVERFQDQFKRAALRRPGDVEQAANDIVTTFEENQTDLDEINLIARSSSYHALLQPEQRDALLNKMSGFTQKTRQDIGAIQAYDRKQQTFFRMPIWSLSRENVRAIHQLDRALEHYKDASDQLLNA